MAGTSDKTAGRNALAWGLLCHSRGPAASKMCFALVATLAFISSGFSPPEGRGAESPGMVCTWARARVGREEWETVGN